MFTIFGRRKYSIVLCAVIRLIACMGFILGRGVQAVDQEIVNGQQARPVISERKRAKAEEALDEALEGGRPTAVLHLVRRSDKEEKRAIFESLARRIESDPDPGIRVSCVNGMRAFDKAGAEIVARALASDPELRVRRIAVDVLQSVGTEEQVEVLVEAIRTNRNVRHGWEITEQAVAALGSIGGQRAIRELRQLWKNEDIPFADRRAALVALAHAEDLSSLETMKEVVRDTEHQAYKQAAISALTVMAGRFSDDPELVDSVRSLVWEQLSSSDPGVRKTAARSVGYIGRREDIPLLEQLLEDPHTTEGVYTENGEMKTKILYPVRKAAAEAIARINKRYPPQEKSSASTDEQQGGTTPPAEPNESAGQRLPATIGGQVARYVLGAIGIGIAIVVGIALMKKKQTSAGK